MSRGVITAAALAINFLALFMLRGVGAAAGPPTEENWRRCASSDVDESIDGCTAIIQSDTETGNALAEAFTNRGIASYDKSQYNRVILEDDLKIRSKPANAIAFYDHGIATKDEREQDRTAGDYVQAIWRKPDFVADNDSRGVAYDDTSLVDRAIQDFDKAIG